jgi:hypothetical protein
MFIKKAATLGSKAVHSPMLRRGVHTAAKITDVLNTVGVPIPGMGAINKGLQVADKILEKVNEGD